MGGSRIFGSRIESPNSIHSHFYVAHPYSGTGNFGLWAADVMGVNLGDGLTGRHFTTLVQVTDPATGVGKDDFYDTDFAGFFEDTWKVRSDLTLNLGVRYDLQSSALGKSDPVALG